MRAAQKLGLGSVPVVVAIGWSDAKKRAYVIADNRIAENATWDAELLRSEVASLQEFFGAEGFGVELLGFSPGDELLGLGSGDGGGDGTYSRAIVSPIYRPTGERPRVAELADTSKTAELVREIDSVDLPPEVADFLRAAATRHTVFDFAKIAEFYAQADEQTQRLFERQALVIIDFGAAIERGFVSLSERLGALADARFRREE